jgi:hypothetical protein
MDGNQMLDKTLIARLESWFASNCDGDWEHGPGIKLFTLDNPGWSLFVNLTGTPLEDATLEKVGVERTDNDWYWCWVEAETFKAAGGPHNLADIIRVFVDWAEAGGRHASTEGAT